MSLPVPTLPELYTFTGVASGSLPTFATEALAISTFMMSVLGRVRDLPEDPELVQLIKYGILDMSYDLVNKQPFAQLHANGLSSESIGSYSYSKPFNRAGKDPAAPTNADQATGVFWFDLAVDRLREASGVDSAAGGGVTVFEFDNVYRADDGSLWLRTDADFPMPPHGGFDDNIETSVQTSWQ